MFINDEQNNLSMGVTVKLKFNSKMQAKNEILIQN
jgi:hypothetical protein